MIWVLNWLFWGATVVLLGRLPIFVVLLSVFWWVVWLGASGVSGLGMWFVGRF